MADGRSPLEAADNDNRWLPTGARRPAAVRLRCGVLWAGRGKRREWLKPTDADGRRRRGLLKKGRDVWSNAMPGG